MKVLIGRHLRRIVILGLSILAVFSFNTKSQEVCVISEKTVDEIRGFVFFGTPKYPIKDAKIIVLKRRYIKGEGYDEEIIMKFSADERGYFEATKLPRGKYVVRVSGPGFVDLSIPVKLVKGKSSKYSKVFKIKMGGEVGVSCGGGAVTLTGNNLEGLREFLCIKYD